MADASGNVFSVDVEDYFHVEAFSDVVDRQRWESYPCRVEATSGSGHTKVGDHQAHSRAMRMRARIARYS